MSSAQKTLPIRAAKTAAKKLQTTIISARDAWGTEVSFEVTWLPEIVEGIDPAQENIGNVRVLWDGCCPAFVKRSTVNGSVDLFAPPIQVTGWGRAEVCKPRRVDSLGDLYPGAYFAEELVV